MQGPGWCPGARPFPEGCLCLAAGALHTASTGRLSRSVAACLTRRRESVTASPVNTQQADASDSHRRPRLNDAPVSSCAPSLGSGVFSEPQLDMLMGLFNVRTFPEHLLSAGNTSGAREGSPLRTLSPGSRFPPAGDLRLLLLHRGRPYPHDPSARHLQEHPLLSGTRGHSPGPCAASAVPPISGLRYSPPIQRLGRAGRSLPSHCLLLSFLPLYPFCFLGSGFCFMDSLSNHPTEKTPLLLPRFNLLESPLDCKEIQPVHPQGNQS